MNSWTLGLRDLDQSLGCISNKNDTIWEKISASTLWSHSHWDKHVVENCLCTFGARFCSEEIFKARNLSENVIVMFDETTPSTKTHQRDIRPDLPVAAKVMAGGNINQRVVKTWQSGLVQRIFPLGLDIGILGNLNISLLCFLCPRTTTNIIKDSFQSFSHTPAVVATLFFKPFLTVTGSAHLDSNKWRCALCAQYAWQLQQGFSSASSCRWEGNLL